MIHNKAQHEANPNLLIEDIYRLICEARRDQNKDHMLNKYTALLIIDKHRYMTLKNVVSQHLVFDSNSPEPDSFMGMKIVETFAGNLSIAIDMGDQS